MYSTHTQIQFPSYNISHNNREFYECELDNSICERMREMSPTCPKNVCIAVLFLRDPRPSLPFINAWLKSLGLGLKKKNELYLPITI